VRAGAGKAADAAEKVRGRIVIELAAVSSGMRGKLVRKSFIPERKGVDCLGKGEIASLCTRKFRGNSSVINNLSHGEARARPYFPALLFPEVFPMTAPAISAPAPKGRRGNGQLRRQVAVWLAARAVTASARTA
jgi:hypothetical protein